MTTARSVEYPATAERPAGPFPGLRPYEAEEASFFFGRDGQVGELVGRLRRWRFLAVVGTSGSGKSSLVRAGLLPALHDSRFAQTGSGWQVAMLRPGDDPIGNLARALPSLRVSGQTWMDESVCAAINEGILRQGGLGLVEFARRVRLPPRQKLLVVVDRFADLFRLAPEMKGEGRGEDPATFVRLLLEAAGQTEVPVYVVIILRAAYLGVCAEFRGLPEAINRSLYLIPRLTRDEAGAVITGAARVGGAEVAHRFVQRMLNDLWGDPLRLPVFQHALMRTWGVWRREGVAGGPLDLCHYEEAGGLAGALSRHADEAWDELPDAGSRAIAERLFRALARECRDGGEYGDVLKLREVCALTGACEADVAAVVEVFRRDGRSFITPPPARPLTAESLLELSYADLLHGWGRLKSWAEAPRQG